MEKRNEKRRVDRKKDAEVCAEPEHSSGLNPFDRFDLIKWGAALTD